MQKSDVLATTHSIRKTYTQKRKEETRWDLIHVWDPKGKYWKKISKEKERVTSLSAPRCYSYLWYGRRPQEEVQQLQVPALENQYFAHLTSSNCAWSLTPPEYVSDCGTPGLQGLSCFAVPVPDLKNLQNLRHLHLYRPWEAERALAQASNLTNLRQLILLETGLREVPASWSALQQLEVLQIPDGPGLAVLLEYLPLLKELRVEGDSQQVLTPAIGSLSSLEELSLYGYSSLQGLPSSLGSLSSLRVLSLCNCSSLKALPGSFGKLSSLQDLNMRHCFSLQKLPESFADLSSLQTLDLYGCSSLQRLPLILENLVYLDLSNCKSLQDIYSILHSLVSSSDDDDDDCH